MATRVRIIVLSIAYLLAMAGAAQAESHWNPDHDQRHQKQRKPEVRHASAAGQSDHQTCEEKEHVYAKEQVYADEQRGTALCQQAQRKSIFVDQSSLAWWEDGSASAPFKTITEALELARKIRFGAPAEDIVPSKRTINLHVAAGTYVGSFARSDDPLMEKLPVLLNVPRLKFQGAQRFDEAGDIVQGTETILRAATRQGPKQHMLVVTRTNPTAGSGFPESLEMAGDAVTIAGFSFDGWAADGTKPDTTNASQSALIYLDGVADFVVRENHITHAGTFGITARLSSGRIENNLIVDNRGLGLNISGGSEIFPAEMEILDNRVRNNGSGGAGLQGAAQTESDRADLFNAHTFRRVPLPQYYDRAQHPEEVPDKLDAYLKGNEFSGSGLFGVRVHGYVRDNYRLQPLDPGNLTANVTAQFVGNVFKLNGSYGVVVDGGQILTANARKHLVNIDVSFKSTTLEGNGWATADGRENAGGPALFGFWRYASSHSATAERDLSFKFAHDSTIKICGDLTRFSYENRAADPTDQTPTNNMLTVNNTALAGFCVPLYSCILELPPTSPGCRRQVDTERMRQRLGLRPAGVLVQSACGHQGPDARLEGGLPIEGRDVPGDNRSGRPVEL